MPQTYCGERVGAFCGARTGRQGVVGDGDPMDICVLTEKDISHGDIILKAIPIGGLRMIDGAEADDKIIAVLQDDAMYGGWQELTTRRPRWSSACATTSSPTSRSPAPPRRGSRSPMSTTATKPTT